jgi:hypothetical protein
MGQVRFTQLPESEITPLLARGALVLTSVNYEIRTLKLFDTFIPNKALCRFVLLVFKSKVNNVGILEFLKEENMKHAAARLTAQGIEPSMIREELVSYPVGFDSACFVRNVCDIVRSAGQSRIIIDITGMPRRAILSLLQAVDDASGKMSQLELYATYTVAGKYTIPPSPQEAGVLQGVFSGKPISELVEGIEVVRTVMVPSIHGTEARLLLDEIRGKKVEASHLLVPLYAHDLLTSMTVLRKDSRLLQTTISQDFSVNFTFSTLDAAHRLLEFTDDWVADSSAGAETLNLIAPFNVKLLLLPSYYSYKALTRKGHERTDIVWPSMFHYSSLYSTGYGETAIWKIDL